MLGILKFSELAIFILNQEINYPLQPPPARLERATSQEVALFYARLPAFTPSRT